LNLGRELDGIEVESTENAWRCVQPEAEVLLAVELGQPARIEHETVETASATLEGLTKMPQGVAVTASWDLSLDAGDTFNVETRWRLVVNEGALTKTERGVGAAL
jgi:hypothetical protein